MMKEKVEERLNELRAEFKAGQEILADLEARRANVGGTLARISGAIQVLEELLKQEAPPLFSVETHSEESSVAAE